MVKFNLYVTEPQMARLESGSKKTGLTIAEFARRVIDAGLTSRSILRDSPMVEATAAEIGKAGYIPCSERQPAASGRYTCCRIEGDGRSAGYVTGRLPYNPDHGWGEWGFMGHGENVVGWKPNDPEEA